MAPALRKTKSQPGPATATRSPAKSLKPEKRKAADDGSPVSTKKQKAHNKPKKSILPKTAKSAPPPNPTPAAPDADGKALALAQQSDENEEWGLSDGDGDDDDEVVRDLVAAFDSKSSEHDVDGPPGTITTQPGQDLGKIPKLKGLKKKSNTVNGAAEESAENRGTMWISRLPHGFYEHQMRAYFEQFGEVTRLRLSRNRKTGASKHYAFIEFADADVAEIAAATMNNYLMYGHILKCRVLTPEQIHPKLWIGANRRFKKVPWAFMEGRKLARPRTEGQWEGRITREAARRAARAEKLKEMDYEYDAPELRKAKAIAPAPAPAPELNATEEPLAIENGEEVQGLLEAAPEAGVEGTPKPMPRAEATTSEPPVPASISATKARAKKGAKATKKR